MVEEALTAPAAPAHLAGLARDADVGRETIGHAAWRALLLGAPPLAS